MLEGKLFVRIAFDFEGLLHYLRRDENGVYAVSESKRASAFETIHEATKALAEFGECFGECYSAEIKRSRR